MILAPSKDTFPLNVGTATVTLDFRPPWSLYLSIYSVPSRMFSRRAPSLLLPLSRIVSIPFPLRKSPASMQMVRSFSDSTRHTTQPSPNTDDPTDQPTTRLVPQTLAPNQPTNNLGRCCAVCDAPGADCPAGAVECDLRSSPVAILPSNDDPSNSPLARNHCRARNANSNSNLELHPTQPNNRLVSQPDSLLLRTTVPSPRSVQHLCDPPLTALVATHACLWFFVYQAPIARHKATLQSRSHIHAYVLLRRKDDHSSTPTPATEGRKEVRSHPGSLVSRRNCKPQATLQSRSTTYISRYSYDGRKDDHSYSSDGRKEGRTITAPGLPGGRCQLRATSHTAVS
ncbi:hypothetical protein B0H14DRAFT_1603839 [Mycena olivaceomarginata]|nr:hypothetical protein B0H14DRAFT_1603839 [Mycena olivaceomarginata]